MSKSFYFFERIEKKTATKLFILPIELLRRIRCVHGKLQVAADTFSFRTIRKFISFVYKHVFCLRSKMMIKRKKWRFWRYKNGEGDGRENVNNKIYKYMNIFVAWYQILAKRTMSLDIGSPEIWMFSFPRIEKIHTIDFDTEMIRVFRALLFFFYTYYQLVCKMRLKIDEQVRNSNRN